MKSVMVVTILSIFALNGFAQQNINFLGNLTYSEELSDVWGYVDGNGKEYALVGVYDGTSIVDVSNPTNPVELFFIPGPESIWRDMKVWDEFAYVTNESDSGLLIIDLQNLPNSIQSKYWRGDTLAGITFESAHNIFIDEQGYGFIVGADYGKGGAIIVDLFTDPWHPKVETVYNIRYIHDLYVRNDTMWSAEINNGIFSVVDVSDKTPATIPGSKVLGTQATSFNFAHNIWLSGNGKNIYTTDEISGAFLDSYDVSDVNNIKRLDMAQSNPGSGVIPHNTFWLNNYLITSYYRDGVTVHDVTYPDNIIQTGYYDTNPLSGNGFNGAWGVYPYLPSGNLLVSDIEEGLFVLGPDYKRAAYLEGVVTDTFSANPIQGVDVKILGFPEADDQTKLLGDYKTGLASGATVDVQFFKFGYYPKTINNVLLTNGVLTTLNVELKPLPVHNITGQVIDSVTNQGIPFAEVRFIHPNGGYNTTANANGQFQIPNVYELHYTIYAGKWGYVTDTLGVDVNGSTTSLVIKLGTGYYDDFLFDFGWAENGTANTGKWERDIPIGTIFGPVFSNPGFDIANDFGEEAYVTGNGGGGVGDDDVDNGHTILTSPVFDLSAYGDPYLTFYRWFFNGSGSGAPNDSLIFRLSNGVKDTIVDIAINNDPDESAWAYKSYRISDYLPLTANMRFTAYAVDLNPGHLVEGGLDVFYVFDSVAVPEAYFGAPKFEGCTPFTVTLKDSSANATSWSWSAPGSVEGSSNQKNPAFTYTAAGNYSVELIVSNVSGKDTLERVNYIIVHPSPVVTTSSTAVSGGNNNGTATASVTGGIPPYTYLWDDPAQQMSSTATDLATGMYHITVTGSNGCETVDSVHIGFSVGLDNELYGALEIYPNPNNGRFAVQYNVGGGPVGGLSLRIQDVSGKLLEEIPLPKSAGYLQLNKSLASGIYLIGIYNSDQNMGHCRLMIE